MHGMRIGGAGLLMVALGTTAGFCARADQPPQAGGASDSTSADTGDTAVRPPIGDPAAKDRPRVVVPRQDSVTTQRPADE